MCGFYQLSKKNYKSGFLVYPFWGNPEKKGWN